jgi:hypothetical protein
MKMGSKYRIVKHEEFGLNNKINVRYEPQHKWLGLFWCGYYEGDCDSSWSRTFPTLQEAENFLVEVERMGGSTTASTVVAEYK